MPIPGKEERPRRGPLRTMSTQTILSSSFLTGTVQSFHDVSTP